MYRVRNIIFSVLAVLWMTVIFVLSSKPAEESNANSDAVEKVIGQLTISDFEEKTETEVQNFIWDWRIFIRKAAHACEYGMLAIFIFLAIPSNVRLWMRRVISVAGSVIYGISDEIHQTFIPGRTALVSDVLIDAGGALAGGVLVFVIATWVRKHSRECSTF